MIGLAVATKYNAALLVLPAAFAILDDPLPRPIAVRLGGIAALGVLAINVYDRQDEFFVPLAGFHDVERPGPNIRIFVRRGAS